MKPSRDEPGILPPLPELIAGLGAIAADYDGLLCDVWGVLHDGAHIFPAACEALVRFRRSRGPVVLLSNAPRRPIELEKQFERLGLAPGCYDAIVTSGGTARADLESRLGRKGGLPLYYLGPDSDLPILDGLDVRLTGIEEAALVFCVGLRRDLDETPADYAGELEAMRARNLTMLCANPDIKVYRGDKLAWCAGALAHDYEKRGGKVLYYGKPYPPVYGAAQAAAPRVERWLAVGDGLQTDLKGAAAAGLDALFIADGVHGDEIEPYTAAHLAELFARHGVKARSAMRALVW